MSLEKTIFAAWKTAAPYVSNAGSRMPAIRHVATQAAQNINFKLSIAEGEKQKLNQPTSTATTSRSIASTVVQQESPESGFVMTAGNITTNDDKTFSVTFSYTSSKHELPVALGTATFTFRTLAEINQDLADRGISFNASSNFSGNDTDISPANVPENFAIHASFSNTQLRKLLESDSFVVSQSLAHVAAEERLRAALEKAKINAAARVNAQLTPSIKNIRDLIQLQGVTFNAKEKLAAAIEGALTYFAENNEVWAKNHPLKHYTDICNILTDLLENPSEDQVNQLAKLASQAYGHRDWSLTGLGITLVIAGSGLELELLILLLLHPMPVEMIAVAVFALAMAVGGIAAIFGGSPKYHSAELYKVESAAHQLPELRQSSSFSFFSSEPSKDAGKSSNSPINPTVTPQLV